MIGFIAFVTMHEGDMHPNDRLGRTFGLLLEAVRINQLYFMYRFLDGSYNHVYSVQDGHLRSFETRGQCFESMYVAV